MAKDPNLLPDTNEELVRHLQETDEIVTVSILFASLKTNERRVSFLYDLLEERGLLPRLSIDGKSNESSEKYRQKGNEMFKKKRTREAHEFYTKSITFAETGGENLSLAYGNRSAVLFENRLYEECLSDINRALESSYPEALKPKLLARQAKAKSSLPGRKKIEFFTPVPSIPEADRHPLIQSAANSVAIESSETLGRHIVATRDIGPGEIIAIEKSFCHNLLEQQYIHCHHCLKLCYTLIPCPGCTIALFCNETCRTEANLAYHQYECPILLTIQRLNLTSRQLHLRLTIFVRDKYLGLDQCVLNKDGVYRSDRYEEIYNLVGNTSLRSVSDIFNRAVSGAVFYHLLKKFTNFFEGKSEDFEAGFKELILLHMQIGPCNFHEVTEIKSSDHSSDQEQIGDGAYSFLSMFNHSCCPNVIRYCYDSTVVAITIELIRKGEQCFDNYGYHHAVMSRPDRKFKLKKQYFFDCSCIACTDNYPLYESLTTINNPNWVLSLRDIEMLQNYNLKEAKKIFKKLVGNIVELQGKKPNRNLAELQEAFKHCCFIFRTIKTPI